MSAVAWWGYLTIFAAAAGLALVFTPAARALAVHLRIFDHPGGYKRQSSPTPFLGGLAIVAAFIVSVLAAAWLRAPRPGFGELAIVMALGLGLAVVGLLDDLRHLSPWTRLGAQVTAAIVAVSAGLQVSMFGWQSVNVIVTVLWIVGVTNAFNLLDNMDGLSAGVAGIAGLSLLVIAALNGQFLVGALSAALTGCAVGFLWHNFHPASIYMGDAGSLFFGLTLSILGLKLRFDGPTEVTFFVPILVMGVALLDTMIVIVSRIRNGRNPMSGGRDHVSHRLVQLGLPVRGAVGVIYASAFAAGWTALVMSRVDRPTGFIIMGGVVLLGLFVAGMLLLVPVYEETDADQTLGVALRDGRATVSS